MNSQNLTMQDRRDLLNQIKYTKYSKFDDLINFRINNRKVVSCMDNLGCMKPGNVTNQSKSQAKSSMFKPIYDVPTLLNKKLFFQINELKLSPSIKDLSMADKFEYVEDSKANKNREKRGKQVKFQEEQKCSKMPYPNINRKKKVVKKKLTEKGELNQTNAVGYKNSKPSTSSKNEIVDLDLKEDIFQNFKYGNKIYSKNMMMKDPSKDVKRTVKRFIPTKLKKQKMQNNLPTCVIQEDIIDLDNFLNLIHEKEKQYMGKIGKTIESLSENEIDLYFGAPLEKLKPLKGVYKPGDHNYSLKLYDERIDSNGPEHRARQRDKCLDQIMKNIKNRPRWTNSFAT